MAYRVDQLGMYERGSASMLLHVVHKPTPANWRNNPTQQQRPDLFIIWQIKKKLKKN